MTAVPLFFEEHGKSDGHVDLLLIAGHGARLTDWYPELIAELVTRKFHVVTFDNRRTPGSSPHFDDAGRPDLAAVYSGEVAPPYALEAMADDVALLIGTLKLDRPLVLAHSLGTMIAQCLALSQPQLVRGMVLVAGTTGDRNVGQPRSDIAAELIGLSLPFRSTEDPLDAAFESSSRWASWDFGMTEERLRERLAKRLQGGAGGVSGAGDAGSARQLAAVLAAQDRTPALRELDVPTIVIHGARDPLVAESGGEALAAAIPGAELIIIEELRHDLPPPLWPIMIDALERLSDVEGLRG